MFSALKKLTRSNEDRCPPPTPMSSSLQRKFSRGVHFNMKILIKGDRNVGKSCLLQRLQGGPFTEDYVPTEQIQVAPIHWTYKNSDFIVKVEVWEVVDKGKTKKKPPLGLKLENQITPTVSDDGYETPVLDATFLDVYKNASGVILMLDITKPWTFDYVVKELTRVPADLPVVVLGNHCDMQHHRQVHPHHIDQALHQAKLTRTAPIRYAESSMRNGFGLRLLHKFLSVPFLRLQKTSLLEQLQRNQKDMEDIEKDLDEFQQSEESHYELFVDRLANKRRQSAEPARGAERAPSIVLGAGKPIVPPGVNPLLAQSINPTTVPTPPSIPNNTPPVQTQYVNQELLKPRPTVSKDFTPSKQQQDSDVSASAMNVSASSGALDEFYAGTLDSSFLEDLTPITNTNQDNNYDIDSDDDNNLTNPKVTVDEDDLDFDGSPPPSAKHHPTTEYSLNCNHEEEQQLTVLFKKNAYVKDNIEETSASSNTILSFGDQMEGSSHSDFPLWAGDASVRRSPEGGEDPDVLKDPEQKVEKKHKKKKSKDRGDHSEKSERKEKKHKNRKSRNEKDSSSKQQDLLSPSVPAEFNYEEYDSI